MILDLFAGPGGWSEGLRSIGLRDVGIEWDASACQTRAAAGHLTIRADVAAYPVEPFVGRVRGLIASPPCQAWSMAGKGAGRKEIEHIHRAVEACRDGWVRDEHPWEDERTRLILEPLRWAWALRPLWIACEQVPPGMPVWEHMADVLRSWGYDATAVELNAADYGVPQTRRRAFLLAHRDRVRVPEPTHAEKPEPDLFGPARKPWVCMADALGWPRGSRIYDSRYGGYGADYDKRDDSEPARPIMSSGLATGRDRWLLNRPAPTVSRGGPHANGRSVFAGAKQRARLDAELGAFMRVSVEEASTLQGFRVDYPFHGPGVKQYEQVGNAVCPPVAAAIVGALDAEHLAERAVA